jgi:hypothetical protein
MQVLWNLRGFRICHIHGLFCLSYVRPMTETGSERITARTRSGLYVEDSEDYDDDAAAEIDSEDFGFEVDDAAAVQDQGDAGTADTPPESEADTPQGTAGASS